MKQDLSGEVQQRSNFGPANSLGASHTLRQSQLIVILFLILATLAVFWQTLDHKFVSMDDNVYITNNPHVQEGLTGEGIVWAFTTTRGSLYIPLTWLSFMLDFQIHGLNPRGYHLTNLFLHIANTILLFLVLERMTGKLWRTTFVAALFAFHPLHVESVAWVSERKDVLSTLFWMLTIWSYVVYTEHQNLGRYVVSLICFTLGLMAKPMLVTLPFVMLLLDYWPLGRLSFEEPGGVSNSQNYKQRQAGLRLVWEKVPFFVVAAVSSIVTLIAKQHTPVLRSLEALPLDIRIANALISYASYIGKMIWPQHLAVLYPFPGSLPMWLVAVAGLCLAALSLLALRLMHRHAYFAVGWLWYLGTLVPVIGLVQTGPYAMADRFTYVPLIGLFIAVAWGLPAMLVQWRFKRITLAISSAIVVPMFMVCSSLQVQHWHNSMMLFEHAIDVTTDNFIAHINLGAALAKQGKLNAAIAHYSEAIRIKPDYFVAYVNIGAALAKQGELNEAIAYYSEAIRIEPNFAEAYYNMGNALVRQGKNKEAVTYYSEAIQINPEFAEARQNMARVLEKIGTPDRRLNTAAP